MSSITAIGTAIPKYVFSQNQLADFMMSAMQLKDDDASKLRTIFRASGISKRASVLDDYGKKSGFTFYSNDKNFEPFPSTRTRNEHYRKEAIELSIQAVLDATNMVPDFNLKTVTHLITVSCTGFYAPGLEIDLLNRLNLCKDIHRTSINFMGCYAAITAMKAADAFCKADSSSKILIVCTELCSLHFQREAKEDNFLANALFGDGAAAVIMEGKSTAKKKLIPSLFRSIIIPDGNSHMAWDIGDFGFEMKLSAYVPAILESNLEKFYTEAFAKPVQSLEKIKHFAIHPGGKKILAAIEKVLGIPKEKNKIAYQVLKNFGNMSSPTILFVLKEIFDNLTPQDQGEEIVSFAFGPGLTLEAVQFTIDVDENA